MVVIDCLSYKMDLLHRNFFSSPYKSLLYHVHLFSFSSVFEVMATTADSWCVVLSILVVSPYILDSLRTPETGLYRIIFTLEDPTARILLIW